MPGIVGIIERGSPGDCGELLGSMIACMEHETFYSSGTYCVPELGVYSGWVALEDSPAADQPVVDEQEEVGLLFAGEVFPTRRFSSQMRQNRQNRGPSGADFIVRAYRERGERFCDELNGLFSGLLVDRGSRKVYLFNDRYGFERIYFHETANAFYFATEAKALLRVLPGVREFDEEGVAQFVAFGCTLDSRTLFRQVELLPGGSLWTFGGGTVRKHRYFSPRTWESQPLLPSEAFEARLAESFKSVLPRYFEGESRIGISLTGGLDTRMIMACLPTLRKRPTSYTFTGGMGTTLDDRLAARVAVASGLDHYLLRVDHRFLSDFAVEADRTVYITDGCLGILGAHEIYLNRKARELAPIRLTGVFGGEVFRKGSTFRPLRRARGLLGRELDRRVAAWVHEIPSQQCHSVTHAAFKRIPQYLFGLVAASRSQVTFRTPYMDNELVALAYCAPATVRNSGYAVRIVRQGSEVLARIPTDMELLGERGRIGSLCARVWSRAAFKMDYLYCDGMPHWMSPLDSLLDRCLSWAGILGSHKYLRYRSWFRHELYSYIEQSLNDATLAQEGFWDNSFVKVLARQHRIGRRNYLTEINLVLTLEAVRRLLLRSSSYSDIPERPRLQKRSLRLAR